MQHQVDPMTKLKRFASGSREIWHSKKSGYLYMLSWLKFMIKTTTTIFTLLKRRTSPFNTHPMLRGFGCWSSFFLGCLRVLTALFFMSLGLLFSAGELCTKRAVDSDFSVDVFAGVTLFKMVIEWTRESKPLFSTKAWNNFKAVCALMVHVTFQ